ncbi:HlyD family efflux transporter periplasmic adaptor subunit [Anaerolineales bacterium HSG25]|nr:HlyD family efflux transporter periplasmic adaptor subunit [Anaerolineales bacterium HSG25]
MKKLIITFVIIAIFAGGGWWAYQQYTQRTNRWSKQTTKDTEMAYKLVDVGRETLRDVVNASGKIEHQSEVALNFEISGVIEKVLVKRGQHVQAGDVLAQLDTEDLELAIVRAEIQLAQSEADLQKLFEPTSAERLAASQAKVQSVKARLAELENDPDREDELTKTAAALSLKQVTLQKAQWDYDKVAYRGDTGARSQADTLQSETLAYEQALADYNIAMRNLDVSDGDLTDARYSVLQAQADLAALLEGPSASDVANKQAAIQLAELNLTESKNDVEQATLVAPNGGVVLDVTVELGERVLQSSDTAAFLLADTSAYLLTVEVDEIDIGRIRPGQMVVINLDAFSDYEFSGQVIDIAPRPINSNNDSVVMYEVIIEVDHQSDSPQLLSGMTAYATIETQRLDDVLVVPNQAIKVETENRQPVMYVEMENEKGQPTRQEIVVGLRQDGQTQVLAGLEEDDQVIIRKETVSRGDKAVK